MLGWWCDTTGASKVWCDQRCGIRRGKCGFVSTILLQVVADRCGEENVREYKIATLVIICENMISLSDVPAVTKGYLEGPQDCIP